MPSAQRPGNLLPHELVTTCETLCETDAIESGVGYDPTEPRVGVRCLKVARACALKLRTSTRVCP